MITLQDHSQPYLEPVRCGNDKCDRLVYRVTIFKYTLKISHFIQLNRNVEKVYLYYPDPITSIKQPDNPINHCPSCGWILDMDKFNLDRIAALEKELVFFKSELAKEMKPTSVKIYKEHIIELSRKIKVLREEWLLNDDE